MNITQAFNTIVTVVRNVNATAAQHEELAACLVTIQNHLNGVAAAAKQEEPQRLQAAQPQVEQAASAAS